MATSGTLLPTPNARDWKGSHKTKQRDTLPDAVEHGKGKSRSFSPAASPASRLVRLALDVEQPMTAISGRKCLELYGLLGLHGSSLKTSVASLLGTKAWYSSRCALIWKPQVTKSSRLLFRLSPSTLRTDVTGSGLLATPNTMDSMAPKTEKALIKEATVTRPGRTNLSNLRDQIAYGMLLPTPGASDASRGEVKDWQPKRPNGGKASKKINDLTYLTGGATGLKLQPNFAAWMMGYPPGWADLNCPNPNTAKSSSKLTATP